MIARPTRKVRVPGANQAPAVRYTLDVQICSDALATPAVQFCKMAAFVQICRVPLQIISVHVLIVLQRRHCNKQKQVRTFGGAGAGAGASAGEGAAAGTGASAGAAAGAGTSAAAGAPLYRALNDDSVAIPPVALN